MRRMIIGLFAAGAAIALVLPAQPAAAQAQQRGYPPSSAGHLISLCYGALPTPKEPAIGRLACQSYLAGFMDNYALSLSRGYRPFCVNATPTPDQVQQVFESYARSVEARLGEHRSIILFEAMQKAFPCPTLPGTTVVDPDVQ